jgi:nucleoside-diphosphate-sugar epimerase
MSLHRGASGPDRKRLHDDTPFNPEGALLPYGRTKALAPTGAGGGRARAGRRHRQSDSILGPGDHRPSRTGKLVLLCARGPLPCSIGGGFYFVDTRDVVAGILLATAKGVRGANFILPGEGRPLPG